MLSRTLIRKITLFGLLYICFWTGGGITFRAIPFRDNDGFHGHCQPATQRIVNAVFVQSGDNRLKFFVEIKHIELKSAECSSGRFKLSSHAAPVGNRAQQIAWWSTGRRAIRMDPKWQGGDYYGTVQIQNFTVPAAITGFIPNCRPPYQGRCLLVC